MNPGGSKASLTSVQAVRAVAALLVVFFHNSGSIFALKKYWNTLPLGNVFYFGHAGVEIFFVLSGFIILHVHRHDVGQPGQFIGFLWKRIRRIYPVYWLVLLLIVPVYFLVPSFGTGNERTVWTLLSSVFLIDVVSPDFRTILAVAWTLYHEVLFYFIFGLIILNARIGLWVMGLWMAGSAVSLLSGPLTPVFDYYFDPLHLLFGMGMVVALTFRARDVPAPAALGIAGTTLFLAAGMEEVYVRWLSGDARTLLYGLGSALALTGVITLERQGRLRAPRILQLTGDASYMIYLVHFPLLSLLAKIAVGTPALMAIPPIVSYLAMVVLVVGGGILAHLAVEKPLLARLSGGGRGGGRRVANTQGS
jgi:peptidoglycan/LPS O-acetylase OafA/YrhL